MKKFITLALLLSFKILPAQNQEERFTMRIVEPKGKESGSLSSMMSEDPRIKNLFNVEIVRSRKIESPVIQIIAPDGFKMGTCFLTCKDATMLNFDYYKDIESRTRLQWENLRSLESYKKFCKNRKG
jgi:hypothetical protein